jgi:hypothetical protein
VDSRRKTANDIRVRPLTLLVDAGTLGVEWAPAAHTLSVGDRALANAGGDGARTLKKKLAKANIYYVYDSLNLLGSDSCGNAKSSQERSKGAHCGMYVDDR